MEDTVTGLEQEGFLEPELKYDLPDDPEEFLENILDNYPVGDFTSVRKLIGVGKVVYKDNLFGRPMTAAVVNTCPITLIFGKQFVQKNLRSIEDCVFLFGHEMTHLVLDHFAKDIVAEFESRKLGESAAHIIVDCQVNATLVNSLVEDKYFEFIKRYYKKNEMPYCFLRPDGVPEDEDLSEDYKKELIKLHEKLYSQGGITNKELIDGLMPWFQQKQDELDKFKEFLLGNHEDLFKDRAANSKSEELDELVQQVTNNYLKKDEQEKKKSFEKEEPEKGGEKGGPPNEPRVNLIQTFNDWVQFAKGIKNKIRRAEVVTPSARIFRAINTYIPKFPIRSVIPNFRDRRTVALHSAGDTPIFHKTPYIGSRVCVPCYFDVSGSQDKVIPFMIPVVSKLRRCVGDVVYCFSNIISETKINVLRTGKYVTTGGTDFDPVFEHLLKHNFKQAIILTDGQASLSPELAEKARKRKIRITVGWTCKNFQAEPLSSVAEKTFMVFE